MTAALQPGHVLFEPTTRRVLHVTGARGTWLFLSEVFGGVRASVDTARRPGWYNGLEDLGHPGADIGPAGWMALRDGVLAAEDQAGRVESVRTARERAANYEPAGARKATP